MRVATEAGAGPVASLTVSVDMGSRYESPENNGVCSVIGQSAFHVSLQHSSNNTVVVPAPYGCENVVDEHLGPQSMVYPQGCALCLATFLSASSNQEGCCFVFCGMVLLGAAEG